MGEDGGWMGQPSGLLPNGLLLDEPTPVFCHLNAERWLIAEERISELIGCIQPNQPSEDRRIAVADYVQRLITKCFPCQVFTFGSVPLKTYLPDGDIDLTAFCNNPNMKETWAALVRDILESEEKNENAEFRVKEVQYIQAEVKIIKCLVENIVVDISFNQLGGLCTLCFLEEIDHLISENHLFKRSIILIKAWCYYESRILGAHHGLISTYALETLVLYIFHVFNNSFAGPLEVLYRFLEFFSNFDWGNFCVSLWGPVPISSLPDVTPIPPRKDGGELLLTRGFLEKCNAAYAVFPAGQESQGQPFLSKHFNVIDPLRVNNNLGRSVSKGNFFRIRSAFAFGAKRLARLLECPKEEIVLELNQFFMNTWERHGSGIRPDAPACDFPHLMHSNIDHLQGLDNRINISSRKKKDEKSSAHESAEGIDNVYTYLVQHSNLPLESNSARKDISSVYHAHAQKGFADQNTTRVLEQSGRGVPNQGTQDGRSQRSLKFENSVNEYIQGKYLFARTRSSPELTDTYIDTSSRSRHNKAAESVKNQVASAKVDGSRRKNGGSESMSTQGIITSADEPPVRHVSLHQNVDIAMGSNNLSNNYVEDSGLGNMSEERASVVGAQGMLQEEQDLVNMMSSSVNNFAGQVHMPLNLASSHLPLPFSPSMLASLGYAQRNFQGLIPGNFPLMDPAWASNLQFAQGLAPSHMAQYFPRLGSNLNSEDLVEQVNENYDSAEMASGDADKEVWHERDGSSNGRFSSEDGNSEWLGADDRRPSTSGSSGFAQPSQFGGSSRHQQKYTKESRGQVRDDYHDKHPDTRISDGYPDDRVGNTRLSSTSQASSLRSRSSSEGSWNGSSQRVSKATREKKGRKSAVSTMPSTPHVKGKSVSEHVSVEAEDDSGDWNAAVLSTEVSERSSTSQPGAALYQARCQLPGFDAVQTSGSESCVPMSPMILGPGHRQRADGSGAPPFAFYPTGPPVPFFTMLPVYNIRSDASSSDMLPSHQGREEGINVIASSRNIDTRDGSDDSEVINAPGSSGMAPTAEPSEEPKDILNSDFVSHWKNLQYGRQCQNPHMVYPSPVLVPPSYLQGSFPWDGPGRPLGTNVNPFPQITGYGPRLVPISSVQTVPDRPTSAYPRYVDDMPRYRAGTGTYLPNPASFRDRYSTGARRNNYNYDRNEHHGDRDGNWNTSSKSRPTGRSHNRNQADKSSSRFERLSSNESRSDRSWNSHRHESQASYQSQNGPVRPNSSRSHSANVAYGMYPLPGMNSNGVSSNGPTVPPLVMFYPYDNSSNFGGSPGEPLEFGSLGPMGFMGSNEVSQLMEGARGRGPVEDQRFHGSSGRSSPDQPSSPHLQRRV